jgi:peroxiredoxin
LKILVALVTLLLAFPAGAQKAAPNFEALDAQGRKVRLADFAGKTVVLEWTSRSCPFVRAQYDSGVMQELQRWSTGQGVVWLSVLSTHPSRRDYMPPAEADRMQRERGGASTALLMDPDGRIGRAYGAVVTPHMFIIAPDGKLAYAGASGDRSTMDAQEVRASKSFVRAALQDLAAGRKVAAPASRPFGCTIAYSGD